MLKNVANWASDSLMNPFGSNVGYDTISDVIRRKTIGDVRLTIDDVTNIDVFKNLSEQQKLELISLVYDLSVALYHSYSRQHE